MALVRKYQSGGVTTNDNLLIDVGGVKYLKSDIVGIFKNQYLRDSYSKEFLGNDAELDALFNKIADIYADGLDSGKMRFDSDGRHILDPSGKYYNIDKIIDNPKTQLDYFNNLSVRVMNMFEVAKRKGYIRSWESEVNNKDAYSFDERKIVTTNYFNKPYDYDWSELAPAWFALDSMDDKTKVRKSENRRKILSKVILKEADKIDNDPTYRKRYKFDNEVNNPLAYKEYTKAMREYAEMIANSDAFNESMLELGVKLGTNPKLLYQQTDKDTDALFANITQEALLAQADTEKKKQEDADAAKKAADDKAKQDAENLVKDIEANGVIRNIDPLSTTDISFVENNGIYYITDNISNISPFGLLLANTLLARYGREQILKNWYGWQLYAGRYLENLTNYFTNKTGYRIYAMTYGPLSHSKKIFFAKKPSDKKPTQIKFKKVGVDYHIFDTKGKELANLGSYCYDSFRRTILSNADYEAVLGILMPTPLSKDYDTGEPIPFLSKEVFTKDGMNVYWKILTLLKYDEYDARRFGEILKGVSMLFLSLPEQDQYKYNAFNVSSNPKSWHGSRFALYVNNAGHVVFSWIYGKNELAFVSKVTREEFIKKYLKLKGNVRYIDSGFINSVSPLVFDRTNGNNVDIIGYKYGGKLRKHSLGGSLLDTYKALVELGLILNPVETQQVSVIPQLLNTEQTSEQQLVKQPEEFTVADGVRLGASILDLAGAFMLFPKGLNMASAAVSGASLVGYIGADLVDVIAGKKELWPTLKHDAEIAGVQAIALVNPVKAGQIAPALAKIVPMIPHIAGLLWTYDILADDYGRKSIMGTLDKILKMKVSEINSQDLTNLAFIARTLIGAKMGGKAIKNKVSKGVKKITNKSLQVDDVPYLVKIKNEANPNETILRSDILQVRKGSGKQRQSDKIADIKKLVVEDYNSKLKEGELKVTIEDVEILDAPNGNPIPATKQTYKFNFKDPVDIMSESWAPGRLFETAVQHGSFKDGYVTRESTWLGKLLRDALGEDFDVWFSDEALYRNKQELAVSALAHNLFGGINEIKNLAQKVAQLKESEAFKQATEVQQEQIMSDFLAKNGYLYKPETVQESQIYEGALNKANEIVEVANNLNSMTDVEAASRILGVDNIDTATRWEGNSPENYVTSEMLRKAYNLFKEVYNSNSPIAQAARVSDTQMLVENFADLFNGRPLDSAWKQNGELTGIILTNLTKFQNIANRVDRTFKERYEAINNPTELRAFILSEARKLLDSGKLSKSDYELILNTLNLIRNSKAEDIFRKTAVEEPKTEAAEEPAPESEVPKENTLKRQALDIENLLYKSFTQEQLTRYHNMSDSEFLNLTQLLPKNLADLLKLYRELPKETFQSEEIQSLNKQKEELAEKRTDALMKSNELESKRKKLSKQLLELEDNFEKAGGQAKLNALNEELMILKQTARKVSDGQPTVLDEGIRNLEAKIEKLKDTREKISQTRRERFKTTSEEAASKKNLEQIELENTEKFADLHNKVKKLEKRLDLRRNLRQQAHDEYVRLKSTLAALEKLLTTTKLEFNKKLKTMSKNPNYIRAFQSEIKQFLKDIKNIEKRIRETENDINQVEGALSNYEELLLHKRGGIMSFANNVLISRLQAGGYLKVGKNFSSAIQPNFNDPYGQGWNEYVGSWYNQIGSRLLPGMLDLLAQNEDWLGDNGIIAQLNRDKASLDTSWDANHKANNGAYWGTNVGNYQRRISFDPITTAISNAYSSGRYMLRTNNPSSGEYKLKDDNLFSAITHDAVAFGNVKWLSDLHKQHYLKLLKSLVGDKYKFVADLNGYIYPVAATQTELGDGESWFYTNDTVNDDGTLIITNPQDASVAGSTDATSKESTQTNGTGDGDKSKENPDGVDPGRSGSDPNGDTVPKLSKNPNTNKNWIDLAILAAGELGTIDARNLIKFRFTPQQTYNLVDRVRTGNNAQRTTQEYSSLFSSAPTSSDARYNTAVRLNIGTNYVKALLDAFDKDHTVFYDSYTKALLTLQDNIKRQYETYNANLKDYADLLKYQDNINYMERQKLWQNVSNYLTTKATDIENANKLKTSKYYLVYSNKIELQRALTISEIKLSYWQNLSDEEKKKYGNSMSTYLSSLDFRTAHGDEYDEKIRKANEVADRNTEALIEGIYSVNPKDITYLKTYGSSLKNGGQIVMAKKGSNLNWAKIENARMVNKSINESIKETYKSIRSANRELQKTIRALAPMLKALNT